MIHPNTELKFISKAIGYGVVATEFIPAGTITWVLDKLDREFTPDTFKTMDPIYRDIMDTYCYRNNKGNFILCWDNGRFVNHSFKSNCLTTAYDFEIAIRDIHPGEQLTDDYGYLNITEPFEAVDEDTERKVVYPDDLVNFHKIWDAQLKNVFNKIVDCEQPLKALLKNELWQKIEHIANGKVEMDSILNNYCNAKNQTHR
ncbi:SET domain-containing protein [Winogradskyella forsetii]|uniref:SET domain-containing protein n=1 Tax=Winogradskyella forsetii TaxID=2686077 RepID=UPI0015BC09C9|nr:SET domain-containing protein [Winogradskyella forsetii]